MTRIKDVSYVNSEGIYNLIQLSEFKESIMFLGRTPQNKFKMLIVSKYTARLFCRHIESVYIYIETLQKVTDYQGNLVQGHKLRRKVLYLNSRLAELRHYEVEVVVTLLAGLLLIEMLSRLIRSHQFSLQDIRRKIQARLGSRKGPSTPATEQRIVTDKPLS